MTKRAERWRKFADEVIARDNVFKAAAKVTKTSPRGSAEYGPDGDVDDDPEHQDDDLGAEGGVTGSGGKKAKFASTSGLKQPTYSAESPDRGKGHLS